MIPDTEDRFCFAADTYDLAVARSWVDMLSPRVRWYKLGLEMMAEGVHPHAIEYIHKNGGKVIFDIKAFDVPETVGRAIARLAYHGADMIIVHGEGLQGMERLEIAMKNRGQAEIIGLTVLTSITAEKDMRTPVRTLVQYAAKNAVKAGVGGIVTHARYVHYLKGMESRYFANLLMLSPGIRLRGMPHDDHKQPMTPYDAAIAGVDMQIAGRPVRNFPKKDGGPQRAVELIFEDIRQAQEKLCKNEAPG